MASAAPPHSTDGMQKPATDEQAQDDRTRTDESILLPPKLLKHREPAFPSHLQAQGVLKGEVVALVTIGVDGAVTGVELTKADDAAFFTALTATLKYWRFEPAMQDGKPIETKMNITWTFIAPSSEMTKPENPANANATLGRISGRVLSRGIRRVLAGIVIRIEPGAYESFTNEEGQFEFEVPEGDYNAFIDDPAYENFKRALHVEPGEQNLDDWLITPDNLDAASVVVIGRRQRETQRISLDRFELTHVAGTMGDPLRVIQSLPGVGTFANFLPFPIVRGAPPGDTGYFVDGTSIPLLFHLGVGTSVIHPQIIDKVDFYPGVAPIRFGRYLGGSIEATSRVADSDYWVGDLDVNLFQTGALVSAPVNDGKTRVTAGGRFSYTGLLLTLVSSDAYLNFWDYLARVDHRFDNQHRLKLSAFGAQDELGNKRNPRDRFFVDFHRVSGQYIVPHGDHLFTIALDLGADRLLPPDEDDEEGIKERESDVNGLREYSARPRFQWNYDVSDHVRLETGFDVEIRPSTNEAEGDSANDDGLDQINFISPNETKYIAGLYHAVTLEYGRWALTPSARIDHYTNVDKTGFDPRFGVRFQQTEDRVLKGHIGIANAQQRFFVPVPGLGDLELESPLQQSRQIAVGIEQAFGDGYSLDMTTYFAHRKHLLATRFDDWEDDDADESSIEMVPNMPNEAFEIPLQTGRAFGLEMILRKQRTSKVFGWLAYTLQRIERYSGGQWVLDPLDQTHIVNLVTSYRFRPDYIFGFRFHYNTAHCSGSHVQWVLPVRYDLTCCGLKTPIRLISTSTSSTHLPGAALTRRRTD